MAGIQLGVMGGVKAGGADAGYSSGSATTASGAAFGPSYDNTDKGGGVWAAIKPNDAFGTSFTFAVVAIVALAFIRHSLPR